MQPDQQRHAKGGNDPDHQVLQRVDVLDHPGQQVSRGGRRAGPMGANPSSLWYTRPRRSACKRNAVSWPTSRSW